MKFFLNDLFLYSFLKIAIIKLKPIFMSFLLFSEKKEINERY